MKCATSAREIRQPPRRLRRYGSPVPAGGATVGQPGRADHRPVQSAVAQQVLHRRQVRVVGCEHGLRERGAQVSHEEPLPGVVPGRSRPVGHGDGTYGGADHQDPAYPGGLHCADDRPGALAGHARVAAGARAEAGEHRTRTLHYGQEYLVQHQAVVVNQAAVTTPVATSKGGSGAGYQIPRTGAHPANRTRHAAPGVRPGDEDGATSLGQLNRAEGRRTERPHLGEGADARSST
jgi:hypothetical protein